MSEMPPLPAGSDAPSSPENPPAALAPAQGTRPADTDAGARGAKHNLSTMLLVIASIAAVSLAAWQWYDSRTQIGALREELARRLAEGDVRSKDTLQSARDARELVRELEAKHALLENRLVDSQSHQVALEALYHELLRSRDEWSLAEIEQTLTIAAQHLQLAGNVRAAIVALQSADARLQRIDRPQLAPLRKVINRDIERLQAAPYVDVVGLSLKLDSLVNAVQTLPLAMEQRPQPDKPASAEIEDEGNPVVRIAREMWRDVRALVRIQTVDRPEIPLLAPTQAYFLRENFKLRLLSARVALLQHDDKTFRADVRAAQDWLHRYYDVRSKALAGPLATLKQLADASVGIEVPDINASLDAVRDYKLTREKAAR